MSRRPRGDWLLPPKQRWTAHSSARIWGLTRGTWKGAGNPEDGFIPPENPNLWRNAAAEQRAAGCRHEHPLARPLEAARAASSLGATATDTTAGPGTTWGFGAPALRAAGNPGAASDSAKLSCPSVSPVETTTRGRSGPRRETHSSTHRSWTPGHGRKTEQVFIGKNGTSEQTCAVRRSAAL